MMVMRRRRSSPVVAVAVVGVNRENPEPWLDQGGVEAGVGDAGGHVRWQPRLPQDRNLIVQPRNIELTLDVRLREPGNRKQK